MCEAGEYSTCSDCGPFTIETPTPSPFNDIEGVMFDVEAIQDLAVTGLTFYPYDASGTVNMNVNVYTASGGYGDKVTNGNSEWNKIVDNHSVTGQSKECIEFRLKHLVQSSSNLL